MYSDVQKKMRNNILASVALVSTAALLMPSACSVLVSAGISSEYIPGFTDGRDPPDPREEGLPLYELALGVSSLERQYHDEDSEAASGQQWSDSVQQRRRRSSTSMKTPSREYWRRYVVKPSRRTGAELFGFGSLLFVMAFVSRGMAGIISMCLAQRAAAVREVGSATPRSLSEL